MKVVIVSSLKRDEEILECKEYFKKIGAEVITPLEHQEDGDLLYLMKQYINFIKEADLVVVIPKAIYRFQNDNPAGVYNEELYFGESSTYEMAIANYFGKKYVYWNY